MAKIKCEYCGGFLLDTEEVCPTCGAVNQNHQRVAKDTPTTIEELQSWYKARNLPPEETTRFFIGKNIKEPKAFGIYKDNSGDFVVYKNKANGQRAIRYQGTDEAYAVNELYLRLKEEILKQKSRNIANAQEEYQSSQSRSKYQRDDTGYRAYKRYKRGTPLLATILIAFLCTSLLPMMIFGMLRIAFIGFGDYISNGYYLSDTNCVYYYDTEYDDWWSFNSDKKSWSLVPGVEDDEYIEGLSESNEIDNAYDTLTDMFDLSWDDIDIEKSHTYIDAGHHEPPMSGHYVYDDELYYYLDDTYADYGSKDNSGWYKYNHDDSSWDYYGNYDDRELFDDDGIWYDPVQFYGGDEELYDSYKDAYYWDPASFTDTTWYQSYLDNETAYDSYVEDSYNNDYDDSYDNDWDSDSDYDWDDDYDWDSGGTDWDSDW